MLEGRDSFLGSILSGTLLGYLADLWLNTRPWFIVVGIIGGSYAGFMTMWRMSKGLEKIERAGRDQIASLLRQTYRWRRSSPGTRSPEPSIW